MRRKRRKRGRRRRRRNGEGNAMHHELVARGFSEVAAGLVRRPWGRSRSVATLWGPLEAPKGRLEGYKRAPRGLREEPKRGPRGGPRRPTNVRIEPPSVRALWGPLGALKRAPKGL